MIVIRPFPISNLSLFHSSALRDHHLFSSSTNVQV